MREQIGNIQYRGKRTQLIKAKPPPIREIQGRAYSTVDYGWGPTLVDTNVVGGSRAKYEQSAQAAMEADIAESKRRRDVAPSLTTQETQEALLAADKARKSRLGISETYDPPGSSSVSTAGRARRATKADAAPGINAMDVRPDLTSYKPPDLGSFDGFKVSNNGFDRLGTTTMADSERRNKYFEDNQASRPGSAIAVGEKGKVVRIDPTPKYKAEESMTPAEMRLNRPVLDATRRNYDVAKEEQAHNEQMAAKAAQAKADAAAKEKQADREATQTLEELKQLGSVDKEVINTYSEQLKALQEQLSSGSRISPDGRAVPMTEDEIALAVAEKASLLTEIRAIRNSYRSKRGAPNIGDAINKVIQPGETPPPGSQMMASHNHSGPRGGASGEWGPEPRNPGTYAALRPKTLTEQLQHIDSLLQARLDVYNDALTPNSPEISAITGKPVSVFKGDPEGSGKVMTRYLGIPAAQKSLRAYKAASSKQKLEDWEKYNNDRYVEGAPKKPLKTQPLAPRYEYTPRDPETGLRPLTPVSRSRRPLTPMLPLSLLTPLTKPGDRKKKKKE